MKVHFGIFQQSLIEKLKQQEDVGLDALKPSDSLQDFIDVIQEADDIFQLEDEVAQWIVECNGSPLAAASWMLHFLF